MQVDSDPKGLAVESKDHHAGAKQSAIEATQPDDAGGGTACEERFSVLAELARDPANGLEEIRPGLYRSRADSRPDQ